MRTVNFRSNFGAEPDRERDAAGRPDLQLIATSDELEAVRAQLEGAEVELRALRSQIQSSAVVRETLDIERTRAARAESALQAERERANAAVAAVAEARQQACAALEELDAERQDVAALRAALSEARTASTGVTLTTGPTWDGAAQRAAAEAIGEVPDWRVALKELVRVIGQRGGWDAVVAWCPEERRPTMACVGMWTGADPALRGLETKTWQARRSPASGEFGMAGAHTGATCLPELEPIEDRLLRDAAEAGIESAVFVPIRTGDQLIGMLELWNRRAGLPDEDVVLFLEAIGLQLGSHAGLINLAGSPRWRVGRY